MRCPDEIATILLKLMKLGILQTRGWSTNDPNRCFDHADHIHNLPDLILHFSPECLDYYWRIERPSFSNQISESERAVFEGLWEELRIQVESLELEHASTLDEFETFRAGESP
jgi:hypothetical protein